ncbi:MAG: hypothetical protein U0V72_04490 [Cytophagales bacterium]
MNNLNITNPCSEKWGNMQDAKDGKFCNQCNLIVKDFTAMSNEELIQFFKNHSSQKVCGRFNNYQLEQERNGLQTWFISRYHTWRMAKSNITSRTILALLGVGLLATGCFRKTTGEPVIQAPTPSDSASVQK